MPKVHCPNCSTGLKVPESAAGKLGRCPKCGMKFILDFEQPGQVEIIEDSPADAATDMGYDLAGRADGAADSQPAVSQAPPAAPRVLAAAGAVLPATHAPESAKSLRLADHFAFKVASLALCVIMVSGWLLPWARSVTYQNVSHFVRGPQVYQQISVGDSQIAAKVMWHLMGFLSTSDRSAPKTTGACVGFMIFAIGSLGALATGLFSLKDWKMGRTAIGAGVAAVGLAVMLIFWPEGLLKLTAAPYLILGAAGAAVAIGLIGMNWQELSRKFSGATAAGAGARVQTTGGSAGPVQIAALALNMLLLVAFFLPWVTTPGRFSKPVSAATFATDVADDASVYVNSSDTKLGEMVNSLQTWTKACAWGGLLFGLGALSAGVIGLASASLGSWRSGLAAIGGGVGLLGILVMLIGVLMANSTAKDIAALVQSREAESMGFLWGMGVAGVLALVSVGTNVASRQGA